MKFQEMEQAVFHAYHRCEYDRCFALLDTFTQEATGEQYGKALSLKASLITLVDFTRTAEGLTLVDEALPILASIPEETLRLVISALGMCYHVGDVERAREYEAIGNRILHEHGSHPAVQAKRFRFCLNAGNIATLRSEHAAAYWYFRQATAQLVVQDPATVRDKRPLLFWLYIHTSWTCLRMNRLPEAEEALQEAQPLCNTDMDRMRWTITRAELLRQQQGPEPSLTLLDSLRIDETEWLPDVGALYHMTRALAARDQGNLRQFHHAMAVARQTAIDHCLDYRLCEIQRILRSS